MEVIEEVVIVNSLGLHARPAATLVQLVLQYTCDVHIDLNGHRVNAKSIMGLLTLAASQGTRLDVTCNGEDAEEAMKAIVELIDNGFGEE